MTQTIKIRNKPAQHIGVANSAPCPEMNIITKEITENGTYTARAEGATGFDPVIVNVPNGEATIDAFITGTLTGAYRNDRVTTLGEYAFARQRNLISVDLPNVDTINQRAFDYCTKLISAKLPLASYIGQSAFEGAEKLQRFDSSMATTITYTTFKSCYSLTAVILRKNALCTLQSTTSFDKCYHILGTVNATYNPEGLKDGFIFVPDNLLENYRQATNWSTFASQIKPISELEE